MSRTAVGQVDERRLAPAAVLAAYDELVPMYGTVPPLILWRAWELAAYHAYALDEPVLDVGCGDGRFFRKAFPNVRDVIGIDFDRSVAAHAAHSGVYRAVMVGRSDTLPLRNGTFGSAFANCSIEHMDRLDTVLREVSRVLRPGSGFLLSVVTDRFISWAPLAKLLAACGCADRGRVLQEQHEDYHHLVNALSIREWHQRLDRSGFRVVDHVPIGTGIAGELTLLLDQMWHLTPDREELGPDIGEWMKRTPRSSAGLREIFAGLLTLSAEAGEHAGIVLFAKKMLS